jgi:hypothetical protein
MDGKPELYEEYLKTVKEKTWLDCAKYFKEFYDRNKLKYPIIFIHSMNPVCTQNIINLFKW